jgi:hypothetical protein
MKALLLVLMDKVGGTRLEGVDRLQKEDEAMYCHIKGGNAADGHCSRFTLYMEGWLIWAHYLPMAVGRL